MIASLGPFVIENTFDPEELLETSVEKLCDQTKKMTGLTSSQGYNFSAFVYSWKGVCSDANREHVVDLVFSAPAIDSALVTLFCGWACKVRNEGLCLSSGASGCCPAQRLSDIKENIGLAVSSNNLGLSSLSTAKSLQSLSFSSSASSLNSNLFIWEIESSSCNVGSTQRPIDTIFKFHKVIRKDLEYLDVESRKLNDGDETILWQFNGRFRLLWDLYRAHSNVEDEIVFPALESKEALHNVSHSYMLDHKQEEQLFEDISYVLSEFFVLHEVLQMTHMLENLTQSNFGTSDANNSDDIKKYNELATKVQGMCKSIRITLD
ncbi:hypothetical protein JHK85_019035 [Glycine max]|nr:hypothetical protein JHK85_019035 [Glycine max]KAG5037789.1 hypothetical protein JHK86_018629 [Glycine max]